MAAIKAAPLMMLLQEIQFRNPWWLLLALQPVLLWLLMLIRRRRHDDEYADSALLPWVRGPLAMRGPQLWGRVLLLLVAWTSLAIAMSGPRILQGVIGQGRQNLPRLELVVDLSYSMSARDIQPSRLQRVKLELRDLVARLGVERVGLIVYAGRAHVMLPPTNDRNVLTQAIDLLRVRELPTAGSNLYAGLQLAAEQLHESGAGRAAILLLSDGGLSDGGSQARKRLYGLVSSLAAQDTYIYTFGVGSSQGAALLDARQGWLRENGKQVVSHLHAALLQKLADLGNGRFTEVMDDNSDWRSVYDNGIARLWTQAAQTARNGDQNFIWRDLSSWFVLPGGLLILLAALRVPRPQAHLLVAGVLSGVLLGGGVYSPRAHAAGLTYPDGISLYRNGKYAQAAKIFASLSGYQARMAEADSYYHQRQYARAAETYIQSVLDANSNRQRAAALFNLANSYFKQQDYARAADSYRDALHYRPDFPAAKVNLSYAHDLLQHSVPPPPGEANRAGTGHHTAPVQPGTEVGKARVSIGESSPPALRPRPKTQDKSRQQDQGLRLQQVEPASRQVELDKDPQWTYDIRRAQDIRPRDSRFTVDGSIFWQRLYEAEEDFPAPRKHPQTLPGVKPW